MILTWHQMFNEFCFTSNEFILLQMISFQNRGWLRLLKERICLTSTLEGKNLLYLLYRYQMLNEFFFYLKWNHFAANNFFLIFLIIQWNLHLFEICIHLESAHIWNLQLSLFYLKWIHFTSNDFLVK